MSTKRNVLVFLAIAFLVPLSISAQADGRDAKASPFASAIAETRATRDETVRVTPKPFELSMRTVKSINGTTLTLSIPVEIWNFSPEPITMKLNHEWNGGIPPPTDITAAVLINGPEKAQWNIGPGYQVGNLGSGDKTVLEPGQKKEIDVRLNWPGTGSIPSDPLIDETVPGTYPIRFLLMFESGGSPRFVESREVMVTVTPASRLVEVSYSLDDKSPTEASHLTRILWLSSIQRGMALSQNNWLMNGSRRVDGEAEAKAATCTQLLLAAAEPKALPSDPNQILTARVMVDGKWLTKRFPIDKLPDEVRKIVTTLGIFDEDLRRFRFIE